MVVCIALFMDDLLICSKFALWNVIFENTNVQIANAYCVCQYSSTEIVVSLRYTCEKPCDLLLDMAETVGRMKQKLDSCALI